MKKILYINDYETFGGAENVLKLLVKTMAEWYTVRTVYAEAEFGRKRTPFSYVFSYRSMRRMSELLETYEPDIIHIKNYCYLFSPSILRSLIAYKRRNPRVLVVHTAHDMHLLSPNSGQSVYTFFSRKQIRIPLTRPGFQQLILSLWDHRGLVYSVLKLVQWTINYTILKSDRVFDVIVSPSEFLSEALKQVYPGKKVLTIRNPVSPEIRKKSEHIFRVPSGIVRLLYIGRLSDAKGIVNFISRISPENWKYTSLTLVGDGPRFEELKSMAATLTVTDRIRIAGYVNHKDLPAFFETHDALVLPSILYENAPLTIIEAALSGLRVITSAHGGMKELAGIVGGAYLFDPDDSDSINTSVLKLIQDVLDGKNLERDYEHLGRLFSIDAFIAEHRTVYDNGLHHFGKVAVR